MKSSIAFILFKNKTKNAFFYTVIGLAIWLSIPKSSFFNVCRGGVPYKLSTFCRRANIPDIPLYTFLEAFRSFQNTALQQILCNLLGINRWALNKILETLYKEVASVNWLVCYVIFPSKHYTCALYNITNQQLHSLLPTLHIPKIHLIKIGLIKFSGNITHSPKKQ